MTRGRSGSGAEVSVNQNYDVYLVEENKAHVN